METTGIIPQGLSEKLMRNPLLELKKWQVLYQIHRSDGNWGRNGWNYPFIMDTGDTEYLLEMEETAIMNMNYPAALFIKERLSDEDEWGYEEIGEDARYCGNYSEGDAYKARKSLFNKKKYSHVQ